ncbi:MAG: hypothetical protein AUK63_760 [bacterium P3]|nr:MAG: hypothetical protein AUK63_760 [bacterium P3]
MQPTKIDFIALIMHIIPYKPVRISKHTRIWVSRYPLKQPYEVPQMPDTGYGLVEFVPVTYPGCGFFTRTTNSQTYMRSVQAAKESFAPTYRNLLFPRQPSFEKLISLGNQAISAAGDRMYSALFESYVDMLMLAQEEDRLERMTAVLRRRMKGPQKNRLSADLKDCKRTLRSLDERRRMAAFDISGFYSPDVMEGYHRMVDTFYTLSRIHHIWDMHYRHDGSEHSRVFFDLGAMDYVCTPVPLPLMRDARGRTLYILPDRVLIFRTPFDFDTVLLSSLDIRHGTLNDGVQSELMLPGLDLHFRFSSVKRVEQFVQSWKQLQQLLS